MQKGYTIITYLLGINPILKRHGLLLKIHLVRKMCKKKILQNFSLIIRQLLILLKLLMNLINIVSALDKRYLSRNVQSNRSYDEYLVENTNCQVYHPVNEEMVAKIINQLKNKSSYGHDGISNILIKQSQQCLTKSLTLIINQCLRSGCFPYQLKLSKVRPVYKSSDTKMFNNYRPISLLPSMSKIFEYVIFHQTMAYFNDNKLLCSNQFGFRPKRSTELAALKLINHLISELDKNNSPTFQKHLIPCII